MPIGGKLVLKGGATLGGGVEKKKKKKKANKGVDDAEAAAMAAAGDGGSGAAAAAGPSSSSQPQEVLPKDKLPTAYEQANPFEAKRLQQGQERSTAWSASYRKPPAVLHGRTAPIRGDTAEERLDLRAASKADRYCK
jgi:hypothetical protein